MAEGQQIGRALLAMGLALAAVGLILMYSDKLPGMFRLPGDIVLEKKNIRFYFPLTTGIIVSVILSLILWFLGRK